MQYTIKKNIGVLKILTNDCKTMTKTTLYCARHFLRREDSKRNHILHYFHTK